MQDTGRNLQYYADKYTEGSKLTMELDIPVNKNESAINVLKNMGFDYNYEIICDEPCFSKRVICVRLYLPGIITVGRYVYTENEANIAHDKALMNALLNLKGIRTVEENITQQVPIQQPTQTTTNTNQPLSQQEILDTIPKVESEEKQKITTAEQYFNDERTLIPFDELDVSNEELNKILAGPQSVTQSAPVMNKPTSFTQEQINQMQEIKRKFNIQNDIDFGKYINAWDKKYSKKTDITPENIESFLQYMNTLGEFNG